MSNSTPPILGNSLVRVTTWNPVRDAANQEIRYVDLSSVDNETKRITTWQVIVGRHAPSRARQLVRSGDILVSTVRPNLNGVARVPQELDGATVSTGFCVLRADPRKLSPEYLFQWVRSAEFVEAMVQQATGASYPAVSDRIIFASRIPLPTVAEQERIAAILDQADKVRWKRRATIAKVGLFLDAIFMEVCGPNIPHISIEAALDQGVLLLHKDGNHGSLYPRAEDFGESGVPFISAKSISLNGQIEDSLTERLSEAKANTLRHGWLQDGDVLLAHNATVGKVGLYRGQYDRAIVGTSLTVFRPDNKRLTSEFLFAALRAPEFQVQLTKNMGQTTRNQVPITAQRVLRIPVPPTEVQAEFAVKAAEASKLWRSMASHLMGLHALFTSLHHRAFNGKLTSKAAEDELAEAS